MHVVNVCVCLSVCACECSRTCEVKAGEWEEVLDVMQRQFDHDQTNQRPATNRQTGAGDRQTDRLKDRWPGDRDPSITTRQQSKVLGVTWVVGSYL